MPQPGIQCTPQAEVEVGLLCHVTVQRAAGADWPRQHKNQKRIIDGTLFLFFNPSFILTRLTLHLLHTLLTTSRRLRYVISTFAELPILSSRLKMPHL